MKDERTLGKRRKTQGSSDGRGIRAHAEVALPGAPPGVPAWQASETGGEDTSERLPPSLKDTVGAYLRGYLSRRSFLAGVSALGLGSSETLRIASALAEPAESASQGDGKSDLVRGRGGEIYVEQLKRCGIEFVFTNPSTSSAPIFDALLQREDMHVVLCPHEGPLMAMASGYARASGKPAFVSVSRLGFPNTTMNMFNAFKDRMPVIVGVDQVSERVRGSGSRQEVDDLLQASEPYTRWRWETRRAQSLASDIRRCFKFAMTPPSGPVFLSVPNNHLFETTEATVTDIANFTLSEDIRAEQHVIDEVAELLITARNPLLHVGDEVYSTDGEDEIVVLAELLSIPVVQPDTLLHWANNFPTDHPLYIGNYQKNMRYPGTVDVILNLGGRFAARDVLPDGAALISVSQDLDALGRVHAGRLNIPANVKLFARDLAETIKARAGRGRIRNWAATRGRKTAEVTSRLRESLRLAAEQQWDARPVALERVGLQLAELADEDAILVHELDGGRPITRYFTYAKRKMGCFTTTGTGLGWAFAAAAGVKLASPERQVIAVSGDGAFMFEGPQALWSMKRYDIPVLAVVLNNRSYDGERRRIWGGDTRQGAVERDMTCYLGDPDTDFTHFAKAYGIEAFRVDDPEDLEGGIRRGIQVTQNGSPFLLDIRIARRGLGAESAWYPRYSLAKS